MAESMLTLHSLLKVHLDVILFDLVAEDEDLFASADWRSVIADLNYLGIIVAALVLDDVRHDWRKHHIAVVCL